MKWKIAYLEEVEDDFAKLDLSLPCVILTFLFSAAL